MGSVTIFSQSPFSLIMSLTRGSQVGAGIVVVLWPCCLSRCAGLAMRAGRAAAATATAREHGMPPPPLRQDGRLSWAHCRCRMLAFLPRRRERKREEEDERREVPKEDGVSQSAAGALPYSRKLSFLNLLYSLLRQREKRIWWTCSKVTLDNMR